MNPSEVRQSLTKAEYQPSKRLCWRHSCSTLTHLPPWDTPDTSVLASALRARLAAGCPEVGRECPGVGGLARLPSFSASSSAMAPRAGAARLAPADAEQLAPECPFPVSGGHAADVRSAG